MILERNTFFDNVDVINELREAIDRYTSERSEEETIPDAMKEFINTLQQTVSKMEQDINYNFDKIEQIKDIDIQVLARMKIFERDKFDKEIAKYDDYVERIRSYFK